MFGSSPWYLGHLGRVPVYVLPDAIFTLLFVGMIAHSVTDFVILFMVVLSMLLIHEFGHAVAARWSGMAGVTILIGALGGMCVYGGQPDPRRRIFISLAGPGANLLTVGLLIAGGLFYPGWVHFDPLIRSFLSQLMWWNLILGVFNLLPIYPLDGGQATLGLTRWLSGRDATAKRVTLVVTVIVAPLALMGATWLNGGSPPVFTFVIIGLLLWQAWNELR